MGEDLEKKFDMDSMGIHELEILSASAASLARKKLGKKAQEEGKAFKRLKDIPGFKDHEHKFKRVKGSNEPPVYNCECMMTAYKCGNCGYVPGIPRSKDYDEIGPLCGSAGVDLYCNNCNEHLGRRVCMVS